jgi:hypothetical protein
VVTVYEVYKVQGSIVRTPPSGHQYRWKTLRAAEVVGSGCDHDVVYDIVVRLRFTDRIVLGR